MPILLPTSPLPKSAAPRPIDYGTWQSPIAGGTVSRLDFLGNRMAVDYVTPSLKQEPDARIWSSRLMQGVGQIVRAPFPQPGIVIGDPGTPVIDASGQGGTALKVRGMRAGYVILEGQWFNVFDIYFRAYIHMATADVVVDSTGRAIVGLTPMLRTSPSDNSECNFAAPVIDGQLSGNEKGWTYVAAKAQGLQYTVTEVR
jgi:hypothetical protein